MAAAAHTPPVSQDRGAGVTRGPLSLGAAPAPTLGALDDLFEGGWHDAVPESVNAPERPLS